MLVQIQQKILKIIYVSFNCTKYTGIFFLQNKKLSILVLSLFKGWGLFSFSLKNLLLLLNKKECHIFFTKQKSIESLLQIFFLGLNRDYLQYLKITGMGYKFIKFKNNLIIKFGFSHRIFYLNYLNIYCKYITKHILLYRSRSLWGLQNVIQLFSCIRKKNSYKKKGLFLKGSLKTVKISSKKSKF